MNYSNKFHVTSGSFAVHTSKTLILEAYLGTCVGVTVVDRVSKIGGLIHLLLPEPPGKGKVVNPEKYASTGIPLLLKHLNDQGAIPENLTAVIAGGALVGPVNQQDLALNIGGRTAEIVKDILSMHDIPVDHSETGGFFSCCLSLDMITMDSAIRPTIEGNIDSIEEIDIPKNEDLKQAFAKLQPIPQIALKIMQLINDNTYDIETIKKEIIKDQVISARTLHLCNSAMFAGRVKIDTLNDAILLLGQSLLLNIIISVGVKNFFNQSESGYSLCKGGLYHHAVGTAVVCERIANKTTSSISPEIAYTAGLLHDIGKVILDQFASSVQPLFYRDTPMDSSDVLHRERKIFQTDHCIIGETLCRKWGIPENLREAVLNHHDPDKSVNHKELTSIVYIADVLMSTFHSGLELEKINSKHLENSLKCIGSSISEFTELADLIPTNELTTALAV